MKRILYTGITTLILSVILLTSCTKWLENEFVPMPSSMKPAYAEGDTFFYKSILTEDIDTFVVSDYIWDTVFNGSILYERSAAIFGEIKADTFSEEWFYISNEPTAAVFSWEPAYVYFANNGIPLDTTIQDYIYTDLMRATSQRLDTTSRELYKIYFDYQYGLVKYVYNNSDSYELFRRPK